MRKNHFLRYIVLFALNLCLPIACMNADVKLKNGQNKSSSGSNDFTFKGAPLYSSQQSKVHVQLESSKYTQYKYKFLTPGSSDSCSTNTGYSSTASTLDTDIFLDTSTDGSYSLCILSGSADGKFQEASKASTKTWYRDSAPPTVTLSSYDYMLFETDNSTQSVTFNVTPTKPYPINLSYTGIGQFTSSTDVSLSLNGNLTIPENTSSTTMTFNVLHNASSTQHKFDFLKFTKSNGDLSLLDNFAGLFITIRDMDNSRPSNIILDMTSDGETTCAIDASNGTSGKLYCWGRNFYGQVGNASTTDTETPQVIDGPNTYKKVVMSDGTTCGIRSDSTLYCWGRNDFGQVGCGISPQTTPCQVHSPNTFLNVVTSSFVSCGVETGNVMYCWGKGSNGALGNGTTIDRTNAYMVTGTSYLIPYTKNETTCAIKTDNSLWCWGNNTRGEVGNGTSPGVNVISPSSVDAGVTYSSVSIGSGTATNSSCGITTTGVLKCWGDNTNKIVQNDTYPNYNFPTTVDASLYSKISIGNNTACAVTTSGVLKCWGSNFWGQVGNGTTSPVNSPTTIDSGTSYSDVSMTANTSCGITTSGALKCWGMNSNGQVGNGGNSNQLTPFKVSSGNEVISRMALGALGGAGGTTTLALNSSGYLKAWGSNLYGQIGIGMNGSVFHAQDADSGVNYKSISLSNGYPAYACGITTNDELKCWGANNYGQIGSGSNFPLRSIPTNVDNDLSFKYVSTGNNHSCGITKNDYLKCWGSNTNGQIGDGTSGAGNDRFSPVLVDNGTKYLTVSAIASTTCGITLAGVLKCWGSDSQGLLGDGAGVGSDVLSPQAIDVGVTYQSLVMNSSNACAITTGQILKCWGYNIFGQLGDGTTTIRTSPTQVAGGELYSKVGMDGNSTCALIATGANSGRIQCWGQGSSGQIGHAASPAYVANPTFISGGLYFTQLAFGSASICAITNTNQLYCWGDNNSAALGNGTTTGTQNTPVQVIGGDLYQSVEMRQGTTCGITTANILKCWGSNYYGQLAKSSPTLDGNPSIIDSGSGTLFKSVSIGYYATVCGITTLGGLKCWGKNDKGQVGMGIMSENIYFPINLMPWLIN